MESWNNFIQKRSVLLLVLVYLGCEEGMPWLDFTGTTLSVYMMTIWIQYQCANVIIFRIRGIDIRGVVQCAN